jgi:ubiquinone/menaquinone biosynthesis C-methylase UbiE
MNVATYREKALAVALDPKHSLHLLPNVPRRARRILDVGCHAGHILEALHLPEECEAFGCDINPDALELARQSLPRAHFALGRAESLPYEDGSFDFLFARGVIVAIDIRAALAEFNRVLAVGGRLWISLYTWQDCCVILKGTWNAHPLGTVAMGAYALASSTLFRYTGKVVRYPLNRSRIMTFQTERRMRLEFAKAGFCDVTFSNGKYVVAEAQKGARADRSMFTEFSADSEPPVQPETCDDHAVCAPSTRSSPVGASQLGVLRTPVALPTPPR